MKISKQKLKQIIAEEMQGDYGPYDKEAEAVEMGKLDLDFEEWAKELENIFVQNGQNINDHSMSSEDWDAKIWTMETPEQYYNRVMGVQEAKKTDCFSRKTFDGKSKCIQKTKDFGEERANAYVASVLRDMGEIKEDYSKQQKENKTMKISKAELMEIIKEEIMGAMSEEEAVEEVAEEQAIEEGLENITPENIDIALQVFSILGPKAALAVGAGMAGQKALEGIMAYLGKMKAKAENTGDK
jgi:regulator of replication initiation timing